MMKNKAGLYCHIPFCIKKCNYCAFLSFPASDEAIEEYTKALISEIKLRGQVEYSANNIYDTIYFGGGTPSLLSEGQVARILDAIRGSFCIDNSAEITLEANPATLGNASREIFSKLRSYREMGINRLSMGAQSMDDRRLQFLGRIHTKDMTRRDFEVARDAGFDNINLDIISSIPGESLDDVLKDVASVCMLSPEHISFYTLQLEENTPFFRMWEKNQLQEIPDELDRLMYHRGSSLIEEYGYSRYEISNFAKEGRKSRHNSKYWDMTDYVGLGLGASGFENGIRYSNSDNMREYMDLCKKGKRPIKESYKNTFFDNVSEAVFTGLRREGGINFSKIRDVAFSFEKNSCEIFSENAFDWFWGVFSEAKEEAFEFAKQGFLQIDSEGMKLTPKGIDISNRIMALFV